MKNKISIIDWVKLNILGQIPNKPSVRKYLDECNEIKLNQETQKRLIEVSNGLSRVR